MNPHIFWSLGLGIFFVALGIGSFLVFFAVKGLIDDSKKNMGAILKGVEESVQGVRAMTEDIDGKLEKTNRFFEIMDQMGTGMKTPAAILSRFFETASVETASLLYGFKEGVKAFYQEESPPAPQSSPEKGRLASRSKA